MSATLHQAPDLTPIPTATVPDIAICLYGNLGESRERGDGCLAHADIANSPAWHAATCHMVPPHISRAEEARLPIHAYQALELQQRRQ